MRVLVTGASGLIGRHTLRELEAQSHSVRAFQRGNIGGVECVQGDVRVDRAALCQAARGCQAIVHLAGRGDVGESRRDPLGYAELIAGGTLNALEAARANSTAFVLASSQRVYPLQPEPCREDGPLAPDSPYGYAKWTAELWCRMASEQYDVPTRVLRFFSVYGQGQQAHGGSGVVSIFARAALAGEPLVVQSEGRRDLTDARDVARGIVCAIDDALATPPSHGTFNIATGVGTSFRELARAIIEVSGSRSTIDNDVREGVGTDLVADVSRAREELGFSAAIDVRQGVKDYVRWLRSCC